VAKKEFKRETCGVRLFEATQTPFIYQFGKNRKCIITFNEYKRKKLLGTLESWASDSVLPSLFDILLDCGDYYRSHPNALAIPSSTSHWISSADWILKKRFVLDRALYFHSLSSKNMPRSLVMTVDNILGLKKMQFKEEHKGFHKAHIQAFLSKKQFKMKTNGGSLVDLIVKSDKELEMDAFKMDCLHLFDNRWYDYFAFFGGTKSDFLNYRHSLLESAVLFQNPFAFV